MAKVWAHRGASGYYPENTMASFEGAVKQKTDGIELDVHLSKDGYLVVCHDETLNRTTNGTGFIKQYDLFQLKQLDAGGWFDRKYRGEKIPLLDEVMELVKAANIELNIEIKAGSIFYKGIEEKVLELIEKHSLAEKTIISSFDHYALVKIKELNPNIKTGILYVESLYKPLDYIRTTKANALHPNFITVTKELVDEAKENGVEINAYTINREEDMDRMNKLGITGIITNYPDKAKEIVKK